MCFLYEITHGVCGHKTKEAILCEEPGPNCSRITVPLSIDKHCSDCLANPDFGIGEAGLPTTEHILREAALVWQRADMGLRGFGVFPTPPFLGKISTADFDWLFETFKGLVAAFIHRRTRADEGEANIEDQLLILQICRVLDRHLIERHQDPLPSLPQQRQTHHFPPLLTPVALENIADGDRHCVICYETFGQRRLDGTKEKPVKTPCNHLFGSKCILRDPGSGSRKCPLCRTEFNLADFNFHINEDSELPPPSPWWMTVLKGE